MAGEKLSADTDRRFVQAVLARGLVDARAVAAVRAEHERAAAKGDHTQTLARALCDRGLLDRRVAAAVLRSVRAERTAPAPALGWFKHYALVAELGRGGNGVVYRAEDTRLRRTVALKMIHDPARALGEDLERFAVEARAAAKVAHPGVVQVFDAGVHEGKPFLAMELVEGQSFESLLEAGAVPPRRVAQVVRGVAEALQYAHEKGVIHRDVKPQNVLLDREGRPRLADFGLARDTAGAHSRLTLTGEILGTPAYLAPEQARGDTTLGPAVDVYALGVVLYRALAGRPPFEAAHVNGLLLKIVTQDPEPLRRVKPGVHADLETIAHRCLAKEPARRYPSAGAVAEELRRFLDGEPIVGRPVGRIERIALRARRQPALATALVGLLLLAVALPVVALVGAARTRAAEEEARREATERAALDEQRRAIEALSRGLDQVAAELRELERFAAFLEDSSMVHALVMARECTRLRLPARSPVASDLAALRKRALPVMKHAAALARDLDYWVLYLELLQAATDLGDDAEIRRDLEVAAAIGTRSLALQKQLAIQAQALMGGGTYEVAEEHVRTVKAQVPFGAAPYLTQAKICAGRGELARAIDEMSGAVERAPTRMDYRTDRALYRAQSGDLPGALADLDEAIRRSPGSVIAYSMRAFLLGATRRYEEALADVEIARRLMPADVAKTGVYDATRRGLAVAAGVAHLELGAFEAAERELDAAIAIGGLARGPYGHRGRVRAKLGKRAEAIADLRHFLARPDPGEEGLVPTARTLLRELEGR